MNTWEDYPDEKALVARARIRFPLVAVRTDAWLIERGWEPVDECPHIWIEAFADRTTEAARAQDWEQVRAHTDFFAREYREGTESIRKIVDVSYAENLMWDLDAGAREQTWPYVAQEVRELYEQVWNS